MSLYTALVGITIVSGVVGIVDLLNTLIGGEDYEAGI